MAHGPHHGRAQAARTAQAEPFAETCADDVFAQGVDNIFLEARDATVHILTGFGAEIAGEPFAFYWRKCHTDDSNANRLLQHTNG